MKALRISVTAAVFMMMTSVAAFAQAAPTDGSAFWAPKVAAGFAIAIAAFGCALGMGRAISAALEGVSRNPSAGPRIMTMMILGLALIESLAIYAFVIAILIRG